MLQPLYSMHSVSGIQKHLYSNYLITSRKSRSIIVTTFGFGARPSAPLPLLLADLLYLPGSGRLSARKRFFDLIGQETAGEKTVRFP
jgi:hypothetical protein